MASRRNLKKVISDIIGDILSECIIYANYVPGVDQKNIRNILAFLEGKSVYEIPFTSNGILVEDTQDVVGKLELMYELLEIDEEFLSRISHTEPGNAKQYYRAFYADFDNRVNAVIEKFNNLKK